MKQHEVKSTKELNGVTFYIRPFPAFTAANISGDLVSVLAPSIGGVVPLSRTTFVRSYTLNFKNGF